MKKFIFTLAICAIGFSLKAQTIEDVLRYSDENLNGSARFSAMSGAFGAVGGDLSAININPAGSAIFNYASLNLTTTNFGLQHESTYNNQRTNKNFNSFDLNQIGAVLILKTPDNNNPWKKLALAFNYDRTNQYDNQQIIQGQSNYGIDNYFLNQANGLPFRDISILNGQSIVDAYFDIGDNVSYRAQQAFLGYYGGVINTVNDDENNTNYESNANYNSVNQLLKTNTVGFSSKLTANFAAQYQDVLYLGAALNIHAISFEQATYFSEAGYTPTNASKLDYLYFDNLLRTDGAGFSFNLGAIAKLNKGVRLGISYQSPTWYTLEDEFSQSIESNDEDSDMRDINFDVVNVYPQYRIKSPEKITGSLAFIFGKQGLLSIDFSRQDFSKATLSDKNNDDAFSGENNFISNQLEAVNDIRIGGEYRLDKLSLRGGYSYKTSPYKNSTTIGDLQGYSFGLGYTVNNMRIDLAFNRKSQTNKQELFGGSEIANVESTRNNISLGLAINL